MTITTEPDYAMEFSYYKVNKLLCTQGLVQSVPGKSQALHSEQVYPKGNIQLSTAKEGEGAKATGAESS